MSKPVKGDLFAPTGSRIVRSIELVTITYDLDGVLQNDDGELVYDYDNTVGSEVYWDTAEPLQREGEPVVQDEEGREWVLSACTFVPDGAP